MPWQKRRIIVSWLVGWLIVSAVEWNELGGGGEPLLGLGGLHGLLGGGRS